MSFNRHVRVTQISELHPAENDQKYFGPLMSIGGDLKAIRVSFYDDIKTTYRYSTSK